MRTINTIENSRFLETLLDVKKEIIKLLGDQLVHLILFGSYARNDQDPESDIDIMILVEGDEAQIEEHREAVTDIMAKLSMKYETLISLTEIPYKRYNEYLDTLPYYMNVNKEGIEIYGKKTA